NLAKLVVTPQAGAAPLVYPVSAPHKWGARHPAYRGPSWALLLDLDQIRRNQDGNRVRNDL
ncbi:MAG: hypothetical protein ACXVB8_01615, partial [Bdellovibrionota bacterium]